MTNGYDMTRIAALSQHQKELETSLASVSKNLQLEETKRDAYEKILDLARRYPFIYINPSCQVEKREYIINCNYLKSVDHDDTSNLKVGGCVFSVFTGFDQSKPNINCYVHDELNSETVAVWCGEVDSLIEKGLIRGMGGDEVRQFIKKSFEDQMARIISYYSDVVVNPEKLYIKCADGFLDFSRKTYEQSKSVHFYIDNNKAWMAEHSMREVADELEGVYNQ
jgi:hypothetical protein